MKRTSILAVLLATLLPVFAGAVACFDLKKPTDNTSTGTIDCTTEILSMDGGFQENGSETLTNSISGNAGTATSLAANGANAGTGYLCVGVDASGACELALVDALAVNGSTRPVQSDALFDHAGLTGSSAHSATSANTASQIVTRDGSGNFSAGTISASLSGNANTATALAANGTNCTAGNYARGVDASGNAEDCTSATTSGSLAFVGRSSGAANSFEFVLQSTAVYRLEYSVTVTTGSAADLNPFVCKLNADTTVGNYGFMQVSYANGYTTNNAGSMAYWGLCAGGGSNFAAQEGCSGNMTLKNQFGLSNVLISNGANSALITSGAVGTTFNTQQFSGVYSGAAPWTLKCSPISAGVGWIHDAQLFTVGM